MNWEKRVTLATSAGKLHSEAYGAEGSVHQDQIDEDKILKIYYAPGRDSNELKQIFYLSRVLEILYPGNFTHIYTVTTQPSAALKEKISHQPSIRNSADIRTLEDKVAKETGVWIGDWYENFARRPDGTICFIDDPDFKTSPTSVETPRMRTGKRFVA